MQASALKFTKRLVELHTYGGVFTVPYGWLDEFLSSVGVSVDVFLDSYTRDESEHIKRLAEIEGVVDSF